MDLEPLYRAVADGRLTEHLDAHPELVTPEVVAACREDVPGAARAGRPDISWVAAMAAAYLQLRLGDPLGSITSRLDAVQARFMMTDDVDGYAATREESLQVGDLGEQVGSATHVFRARVLAADCSYFAAEQSDDAGLLLRALDDVGSAAETANGLTDDPQQAVWMARLASLLAATVNEAWGRARPRAEKEGVDAAMRRIAAGAENLPLEMDFEGRGGEATAAQVASVLAELESRYGAGT